MGSKFFTVRVFMVELVSPSLSVIVRVIVLIPLSVYLWVGFWLVEVVPSPKLHCHDAIEPSLSVDRSVKEIVSSTDGSSGEKIKSATGIKFPRLIVAFLESVESSLSVTISCTWYLPFSEYLCVGF